MTQAFGYLQESVLCAARCIYEQTDRHATRCIYEQTDRHAARCIYEQTDRHAARCIYEQTDRHGYILHVGLAQACPNKHLGINAKASTISVNSCMILRI